MTYSLSQFLTIQQDLRKKLGLPHEEFSGEQIIGMLSDEIADGIAQRGSLNDIAAFLHLRLGSNMSIERIKECFAKTQADKLKISRS